MHTSLQDIYFNTMKTVYGQDEESLCNSTRLLATMPNRATTESTCLGNHMRGT